MTRTDEAAAAIMEMADLVAHLCSWAHTRRTGATEMNNLELHLSSTANLRALAGEDPKVTTEWMRAIVAAPDLRTAQSIGRSADWLALGVAGPVAFAAGVSPADARAGLDSETLTEAGLESLAGLRGWVFPPLP